VLLQCGMLLILRRFHHGHRDCRRPRLAVIAVLVLLAACGGTGAGEPASAPAADRPALPLPKPGSESGTAGGSGTAAKEKEVESHRGGEAASAPSPAGVTKKGPEHYDELTTRKGGTYRDCRVIRVEPDALLIEHTGGVARLSLFDLPAAVQEEWGFDPFRAMEYFKATAEKDRKLKWRLFWERQQYESAQARKEERKRLLAKAVKEWVPVEASISQRLEDGSVVANCQRITFEKTKMKSTLGFIVDGPPKRVLVPFSREAVVLRFVVPPAEPPAVGSKWKGYVAPVSDGKVTYGYHGVEISSPVHLAAAPKR